MSFSSRALPTSVGRGCLYPVFRRYDLIRLESFHGVILPPAKSPRCHSPLTSPMSGRDAHSFHLPLVVMGPNIPQ